MSSVWMEWTCSQGPSARSQILRTGRQFGRLCHECTDELLHIRTTSEPLRAIGESPLKSGRHRRGPEDPRNGLRLPQTPRGIPDLAFSNRPTLSATDSGLRCPMPRPRSHLPAGAHSSRSRRRTLRILFAIPLWVATGLLAVVAVMRLVAWDDYEPFAVLNTVTAFVFLPTWIVLIVAAVGRRFVLAGAALLIGVAQMTFLLPGVDRRRARPAWASSLRRTIGVLDANVYSGNSSMAGYAKEISQTRPQLVTMEEANPVDVVQLERAGVLDDLPYRFEVKRYDPAAFFIASRYPIGQTSVVSYHGRPLIVQTALELPNGPQDLWVVHTIAPLPSSFTDWQGMLSTIARLVKARGPTGCW